MSGSVLPAFAKILGKILLFVVIGVCFAATIVPRYLDRLYYAGPESGHFDGEHFANPDGDDDTIRPPGGGGRASFFWRYLTGSDGRPLWPDTVPIRAARSGDLLPPLPSTPTPVAASSAEVARTPMRVTWVGHASVLVQVPGFNILTDPVWAEKAGPLGFGPRRVARPGIALADLPRIDLVLVSHNHYDHLDLATLQTIWRRDRPMIVTSLGNDAILRSRGIPAVAADWRQWVAVRGRPQIAPARYWNDTIRVAVTRNHHWGSRWFTDRNRALWSSFVVHLPGGNVFFAGDTGFGDGRWPGEAAAFGPIRLALIPIGAFRFVPGQMSSGSHIGPIQAAEVRARLGATTAIPIHWGTFRLSYEQFRTPPALLKAVTACRGQRGFDMVRIGRPVDVAPYTPFRERGAAGLAGCLNTPAVRSLR
ncbi:MBL fold metallo-hydrolase [Sphingomonas sp. Leaf343]|uniref:MBL fold metallo-hydrolase n=1 Tax=Sphingomonas sp. Leaf343 TaxID=1736345 RepID=UPI0006F2CD05|nr:MBL fold metallo-hydrolase [Sphingomonas sp. Leaf343]KQR84218.1 hypothetical protein ASG07_06430 [Sphingomonas sp. Leaf343]